MIISVHLLYNSLSPAAGLEYYHSINPRPKAFLLFPFGCDWMGTDVPCSAEKVIRIDVATPLKDKQIFNNPPPSPSKIQEIKLTAYQHVK